MNQYLAKLYRVDDADRVLQFANYIFDVSVWEMTLALLNGAQLELIKRETILDINRFNGFVKDRKITIATLPPQYYLQSDVSGLKSVTTGGSASNSEIVKKAIRDNARYINEYGPTENTVQATYWERDKQEAGEIPNNIPIGQPTEVKDQYFPRTYQATPAHLRFAEGLRSHQQCILHWIHRWPCAIVYRLPFIVVFHIVIP